MLDMSICYIDCELELKTRLVSENTEKFIAAFYVELDLFVMVDDRTYISV